MLIGIHLGNLGTDPEIKHMLYFRIRAQIPQMDSNKQFDPSPPVLPEIDIGTSYLIDPIHHCLILITKLIDGNHSKFQKIFRKI